jgi:hypothetical protein
MYFVNTFAVNTFPASLARVVLHMAIHHAN